MENVKKIVEEEKISDANLPEHLKGLEYGDVLVIDKFPKVRKYPSYAKYLKGVMFRAGDVVQFNISIGSEYLTTISGISMIQKPGTKSEEIIRRNGYEGDLEEINIQVYPDMVSFEDKKEKKEKPESVIRSIRIKDEDKDPNIIQEMIDLVDMDRLVKIMSISIGRGGKPSNDMVKHYLEEWAKHKYEYFLAFGHQLSISDTVMFDTDESEMDARILELYKKYPKYAATLEYIRASGVKYFIENRCPSIGFFKTHLSEFYKPNIAVSKFCARLFKDNDFDIAFSEVLQDRQVRGQVVVSIDPYDYLTSAKTMHNWSSCHQFDGNMAGGVYSYMIDDASLVAYRTNGKVYEYKAGYCNGGAFDYGKNGFSGNSKSWRQMIYVDKDTCACLFGREYPQKKIIDGVIEKVRALIEGAFSTYGRFEDVWDNYGDIYNIAKANYYGHKLYVDDSNHHYSDIAEWESLKRGEYPHIRKTLIVPAGTDMSKVEIHVGGTMRCLRCGGHISKTSHAVTCC